MTVSVEMSVSPLTTLVSVACAKVLAVTVAVSDSVVVVLAVCGWTGATRLQ